MNQFKDYYVILLDQDQNIPLEEIFRERAFEYFSNNKVLDFWLISPLYLNNKKKYHCILTTNFSFFDFLQLRIGYFEPLIYNSQKQVLFAEKYEPHNFTTDGFFFSVANSSNLFTQLINFQGISPEKSAFKHNIILNYFQKQN